MVDHCVCAARVFPGAGQHGFSLKAYCAGEMLGALAANGLPLFVDADALDWNTLHELCCDYPHLPLVLCGLGYRADRYLYPLLARFDNLYVELSGYYGCRAIEVLVDRFGPRRALFGTRLPVFSPGSAIGMLNYAGIEPEARRWIAGDNLRHLLHCDRDP
jgi:predicted TIM-barrel fold metal-dependent hydrolase